MSKKNAKNRNAEFPCLKYTHIASSVIIIVYGAIFFIGSIHIWTGRSVFLNQFLTVPVVIILIGSINTVAIGLVGIIVILYKFPKGIVTFYVSTCILFIFIIIGWMYLYYSIDSIKQDVLDSLNTEFYNYPRYKNNIDELQSQLHCCGIYNSKDWYKVLNYIPGSCCGSNKACNYNFNNAKLYKIGCFPTLAKTIEYYTFGLLVLFVIAEGVLILSIVLSFIIYKKLQRNEKVVSNLTNETSITRSKNPLAQPSAPEQNRVSNELLSEENYSMGYTDQSSMHNFWTPVVQEYTNNRSGLCHFNTSNNHLASKRSALHF